MWNVGVLKVHAAADPYIPVPSLMTRKSRSTACGALWSGCQQWTLWRASFNILFHVVALLLLGKLSDVFIKWILALTVQVRTIRPRMRTR